MLVAYSSRSELQGVTAVDGAVAIAHEIILDTGCFNIWAALGVYLHQRASMMSPASASVSGGSNVRPLWATILWMLPLP